MWYGIIDAKTMHWAEKQQHQVQHEARKKRIAEWVANAKYRKDYDNQQLMRRLRMDEIDVDQKV